ncbi:MAG: bZIP transcription factor [Chloroflexi bacterium]|nr:bZIP transcription factor [Chloroflexota bacterium]
MRSWLPQRPLTGAEVAGLVIAAFFIVPTILWGGISLVLAISTWPAVIGLLAGGVGALIVQRTLALDVIASRQRITELERENAQLTEQVEQLEATVDRYIQRDEDRRFEL